MVLPKEQAMLLLFFAMLGFASLSFANGEAGEESGVDQAIIVTDMASADAATASAAAEQEGAPVLVAEDGKITDDILEELEDEGVEEVVIVGGPVVIEEEAEQKLRSRGFSAVRLWGLERTETALEVARHVWREGAGCAVLVEDTKDPDADTLLLVEAAALARQDKCIFIPIPAGSVPARVLELLSELGVSKVRVVLRSPDSGQIATDLRNFNVDMIAGRADLETRLKSEIPTKARQEGRKAKLVIIAAPDWEHALSAGAMPSQRSVVRIVTSVNESLELVTFITDNNIEDVRVVGNPGLAQEIADAFAERGINVTKVSGEKASEVAKEILKRDLEAWKERRHEWKEKASGPEFQRKAKAILAKLLDRADELIARADLQIESLKARIEGATGDEKARLEAALAELQKRVDDAKAALADARAKLEAGDLEGAWLSRSALRAVLRLAAWKHRDIELDDLGEDVEEEEEDIQEAEEEVEEKISDLRKGLSAVRARCADSSLVERIFLKARALRTEFQQAREAGERVKMAEISGQAEDLAELAHRIGELCQKEKRLEEKLKDLAERRQEAIGRELVKISPRAADALKAIKEKSDVDISSEIEKVEAEEVEETGEAGEAAEGKAGLIGRIFLCNDAKNDACDREIPGTEINQTLDVVAEINNPGCSDENRVDIACNIRVVDPRGRRRIFIQDKDGECKERIFCVFSFSRENIRGRYDITFSVSDKVSKNTDSRSVRLSVP